MAFLLNEPKLEALLDRLHARSKAVLEETEHPLPHGNVGNDMANPMCR